MSRIIITVALVAALVSSCSHKELEVNDFKFSTSYTPVDTTCWKDEQITLFLNIDNYKADEPIILQYRINNSVEDTLTINGQRTLEPIEFNPHVDKSLSIHYIPKLRGGNVICFTLSNSRFSRQDYVTVKAKEEVTYDYHYNGYDVFVKTIEGI